MSAVPSSLDLVPHVPRLVLGWEGAEHGALHRSIDGTMAFVDISGFTAMSERLARTGKAGAEEVSEIINSIFTRLLAVAYENGGSLLKFGGDALLLFFDGPDHSVRACHAAAWMRRRLRELVPVRTSAGNARLKMHVGIHSGEFDFFVLGDIHRELVIAGPAATVTVEMESAAAAGEIVVSAMTARALAPRLLEPGPEGGSLLARTPSPPLVPVDTTAAVRVDPARFIAPVIRDHVSVPADPEHRAVAVSFIRFEGVDEMIGRDGPAAAEGLDELVRIVQEAAAENLVAFIGTDPERDGGKFMLAAGAPRTSERDEEALLRAVRGIVDASRVFPIRVGVHRGHVFSGLIGPSYRQNFTVMGDAVNLTARLMAKAEPGQIIATPAIVDRSPDLTELTELPSFSVKGKDAPVRAFAVGPLTGRAPTSRSARLPLTGRDRELATLSAAFEAAVDGRGRVVEISAEPGMGKSRLVEELRWRAAHERVLEAVAEQYTSSVPYVMVDRLVREALGIDPALQGREVGAALGRAVEEIAPHLAPWLPLVAVATNGEVDQTPEVARLDEAFVATTLHRTVEELLVAALPTTTLIIVEDLHWADEASRGFLEHLCRSVGKRPWLVCVTRRPDARSMLEDDQVPGESIELAALAENDAVAMVRALARESSLAPEELATLVDRAGGNPLFLHELVAGFDLEGGLQELPSTIEAVIGSRIDDLGPGRRAVLRRAAVLGLTFDADLLREVVADEPEIAQTDFTPPGLERLLGDFVVAEGGHFRFQHALIRDVAYEGLSFRLRRQLHRKTGEILELRRAGRLEEICEVLSLHFERAHVPEKAWSYAVMAGDRAKDRFVPLQAIEFYRRALSAARRLREVPALERTRVSEALGDACERAGRYEDASSAYNGARTSVDPASATAPRLCLKQGVVRLRMGRYPDALRWYQRGLRSPARGPEAAPVRIELMLSYAGARYYQGRYRDCIEWCERALPEALETADKSGLAHAYSLLHLALTHLGSPERAKYRGLALPLYEELGDRTRQGHALNNMGIDAYYEGDWQLAIDLYEKGRRALEEAGGIVDAADVTYNVAEILCDQGRLEEAEELTRQILDTYRLARYPVGEALAVANLGRIAARAGRLTEAAELLEDARSRFDELGDERFSVEVDCHLVELSVLLDAQVEVLGRIEPLLGRIHRIGDVPALLAKARRFHGYGLAQAGDPTGARRELERSIDTARPAHLPYELALSLEGLARVARDDDPVLASDAEAEAKEILTSLGVVATPEIPIGRGLDRTQSGSS